MQFLTPAQTRVTWIRWSPERRKTLISHPTQWIVTEPDGYERCFDTKREAGEWIAENYPEGMDS